MHLFVVVLLALAAEPAAASLGPGDHLRTITVDARERSYLVHVPEKYDASADTPIVLVFHGAGTNARIMVPFCGMNVKADEAGFIAVYPNGTGVGIFLTYNAGGLPERMAAAKPDDVKFVAALLDDLSTVVRVDSKRVYATGMSNGGMMCYRLAAELSDRIAAIAPVGGTMAIDKARPKRPVPLIHFHGTQDRIVPFEGPRRRTSEFLTLKSVEETIRTWVELNRSEEEPAVEELPDKTDDETTVTVKTYRAKEGGADVVLVVIDGGGHTWPGQPSPVRFIGKSTRDIVANDMIWDFFQRYRLP